MLRLKSYSNSSVPRKKHENKGYNNAYTRNNRSVNFIPRRTTYGSERLYTNTSLNSSPKRSTKGSLSGVQLTLLRLTKRTNRQRKVRSRYPLSNRRTTITHPTSRNQTNKSSTIQITRNIRKIRHSLPQQGTIRGISIGRNRFSNVVCTIRRAICNRRNTYRRGGDATKQNRHDDRNFIHFRDNSRQFIRRNFNGEVR